MPGQERENSRQPPWVVGAEGEPISFGAWLRRQREIREIPLREIADVTKISMRYLEALEQDRFDILPAPVFAKGFLREYSRYVGLDPDEVVNSFMTAQRLPEEEPERPEKVRKGGEWASALILALGVVALLALVSVLIFFGGRERERSAAEPPPIAPPPLPAAEPEPAPPVEPAPPAAPLTVTLDFTEDCWVEVSVDGETRLSELHVQGESLTLEAESNVILTLGNPAGARIEVNGVLYEPGLRPGRVARNLQIDLQTAEELRKGAE